MRVSGSRRTMSDHLNGNAAKLFGWLTATLMAAELRSPFSPPEESDPFRPGEVRSVAIFDGQLGPYPRP
jgi:hypothetical protein